MLPKALESPIPQSPPQRRQQLSFTSFESPHPKTLFASAVIPEAYKEIPTPLQRSVSSTRRYENNNAPLIPAKSSNFQRKKNSNGSFY